MSSNTNKNNPIKASFISSRSENQNNVSLTSSNTTNTANTLTNKVNKSIVSNPINK